MDDNLEQLKIDLTRVGEQRSNHCADGFNNSDFIVTDVRDTINQ